MPQVQSYIIRYPSRLLFLQCLISDLTQSVYTFLNETKPEASEIGYSWLSPHSYRTHATLTTFSVLRAPRWATQKSNESREIDSNPFMKRADIGEALALWNFENLRCASESIVQIYDNETTNEDFRLISLRNSNQVHFYLQAALTKLKRFTPKLTQMEDDDWIEKIEALQTVF